MLEQVYNTILSIPDTVVGSIPSLRSPSVLVELKRMRQKIKNKMKIGKTRLMNEQSKSSTLSNISCNQMLNSTNCGSFGMDNSRLSTTFIQANVSNNNNTSTTNKWFDNHSDFHTNTTLPIRQTSNSTDIYSRERLSVNELDCIVNNKNFDTFSVSDVEDTMQSCSVNSNNKFDTNRLRPQTSYQEGKTNILYILYMSIYYCTKLNLIYIYIFFLYKAIILLETLLNQLLSALQISPPTYLFPQENSVKLIILIQENCLR